MKKGGETEIDSLCCLLFLTFQSSLPSLSSVDASDYSLVCSVCSPFILVHLVTSSNCMALKFLYKLAVTKCTIFTQPPLLSASPTNCLFFISIWLDNKMTKYLEWMGTVLDDFCYFSMILIVSLLSSTLKRVLTWSMNYIITANSLSKFKMSKTEHLKSTYYPAHFCSLFQLMAAPSIHCPKLKTLESCLAPFILSYFPFQLIRNPVVSTFITYSETDQ
jgi:hypothetical protein